MGKIQKLEQALTERLTVMSNVLSAIPDPVLVVDTDGVLQAVNPALEWEFGWHLDDILGQAISTEIRAEADSSRPLKEQVRAFERTLIDSAIDRLGGKRKAARALGIDIGTIVRKTQGEKSA